MSTERKIIGATLIALGMLSDSKSARIGLGLAGTAVLFPKESLQVIDAIKMGLEKETKRPAQQPAQSHPAMVIEKNPENKIGLIRKFIRWNKDVAIQFWKWIY